MHLAAILLLLCATPDSLNTTELGGPIEVKIIESKKSVYLSPTPAKPLIPRRGVISEDKKQLGDSGGEVLVPSLTLQDYADQLKAIVDPIWYSDILKVVASTGIYYETKLLIFLDKYGSIISVKVIESSGRRDIDQVALNVLKQVGTLPKPPESLTEGITWSFSIGEK